MPLRTKWDMLIKTFSIRKPVLASKGGFLISVLFEVPCISTFTFVRKSTCALLKAAAWKIIQNCECVQQHNGLWAREDLLRETLRGIDLQMTAPEPLKANHHLSTSHTATIALKHRLVCYSRRQSLKILNYTVDQVINVHTNGFSTKGLML